MYSYLSKRRKMIKTTKKNISYTQKINKAPTSCFISSFHLSMSFLESLSIHQPTVSHSKKHFTFFYCLLNIRDCNYSFRSFLFILQIAHTKSITVPTKYYKLPQLCHSFTMNQSFLIEYSNKVILYLQHVKICSKLINSL